MTAATEGKVLMVNFNNGQLFEGLDRAIDMHDFSTALQLARQAYKDELTYTIPQLLLLCVGFGANVDAAIGKDVEEKKICLKLWSKATKQAKAQDVEVLALQGTRLGRIYVHRRQRILAHSSLNNAKPFVISGASTIYYYETVTMYMEAFNVSSTDLLDVPID